jgi:diaminohydroxyphosphoribosylaminopyrimidine deaminase/5-amino-6-(5-phosphoribosylamino)uracil reductase
MRNLDFVAIDFNDHFPQNLLTDLHARKIQSLLVEGGARLLQTFINQNLWDEIRVFKSPNTISEGIAAPILPENIYLKNTKNLMGDRLFNYRPQSK